MDECFYYVSVHMLFAKPLALYCNTSVYVQKSIRITLYVSTVMYTKVFFYSSPSPLMRVK